ncbi:ABC transporter substrate-binding protein [Pseudonocardia kunmingensis]|uniref:Monosaccharide ABC transporter substrate-binding protein (CUT2 family) n=1 Tax=Pseudonocardia kunmingensis TaxID=630975 RepID=A0A543DK85_9PSEU|nr:ABC transporter substrate-binding protein [Pseudonocardia kunmingensis]TQM09742.1 monosaccharide ABC transporter substrate-binding protein (CUT2 family) [Pseudonocardia kunmingensis]
MGRTRVGSVAAAAALAVLAAGCGGGTIGQGAGGDPAAPPENKNLVLMPGVKAEPFYISMQCGAQEEAANLGYQLTTQAPDRFEAALQTPIVTGVLATRPAGVLIAPTDDVAMANPMSQLKDAGIKVVEVDTRLQDESIALSTVSSDNEQGGVLAARTVAELVGGQGEVLVLNTKAGTSTTDARARGFEQEIANHPGITYLGQEYTENEPAVAAQKVSATLAAHPDLAAVFATNLNSGEGAATGLRNAGKTEQVRLVGFDASPNQVEDLRTGEVSALIAQDPATIGRQGVQQVVAAIEGRPVEREIETDLVAITQADMESKAQYFYRTEC